MEYASIPNPDLTTVYGYRPRWDLPDNRRRSFHELHTTVRYAMSFRAPGVLPLSKDIDWTIGDHPDVARFLG